MKTIEHEGTKYVLKSDVEGIIKERLAKMASRASEAEALNKELQGQVEALSGAQSTVDLLTQQLDERTAELAKAEQRYQRHTAISQHGLTDPDIIELIEWQYTKATAGDDKAPALEEWMTNMMSDISTAPLALRPHLSALQTTPEGTATETPEGSTETAPATSQTATPRATPPAVNQAVERAPVLTGDQYDRALRDPELYAQLREQIKSDFYKR